MVGVDGYYGQNVPHFVIVTPIEDWLTVWLARPVVLVQNLLYLCQIRPTLGLSVCLRLVIVSCHSSTKG
jgi:hypothetical protein